jgi:hypothetical protein
MFTSRHALIPAAAAVLAASTALAGCSGPSYPHSWCGPLITQFHAHETRGQYLAKLSALQGAGAPVGRLEADENTYLNTLAEADGSGTQSYSATLALPAALQAISSDQQQLNQECGQPADAYKSDNA